MKKWVFVLALLMVAGLGSSALAQVDSKTVDFIVDVAPWVKFDLQDSVTLAIEEGKAEGFVKIKGTVET